MSHEETIRKALSIHRIDCPKLENRRRKCWCETGEALAALDALVADRRALAERTREACAKVADAEKPHALIAGDIATDIRALDVSALLADERRR